MAIIEICIDENILKEAEKVLLSIGMDVQIAVSVFLRRVAIEKGLPMSMTASIANQNKLVDSEENQVPFDNEQTILTRSNTTISKVMVDEVWRAFLLYHKGLGDISKLSDEISKNTGMNRGSAFIYLNILSNLVKGEPNTRTMKMKDLEYFMGEIKTKLGEAEYQIAIKSLNLSIPYWQEKLVGAFADKVESYCRMHSKI